MLLLLQKSLGRVCPYDLGHSRSCWEPCDPLWVRVSMKRRHCQVAMYLAHWQMTSAVPGLYLWLLALELALELELELELVPALVSVLALVLVLELALVLALELALVLALVLELELVLALELELELELELVLVPETSNQTLWTARSGQR